VAAHFDKLESAFNPKCMNINIRIAVANLIAAVRKKEGYRDGFDPIRDPESAYRVFVTIALAIVLTSCAAYGPIPSEGPRTGVTSWLSSSSVIKARRWIPPKELLPSE
jgi:hypothetical protein